MIYFLIAFIPPIFNSLSCILDSHFSNNAFKKPTTLLFYSSITGVLILPFVFWIGSPQIPSLSSLAIIFIISVIHVFYLIPYYTALRKVDTSITVALFSLGRIAMPILAWFIVGEHLSTIQYFGFGVILLSGLLINFNPKKLKLNVAFWLMLMVSFSLALASVLQKYSLGENTFMTVIFWLLLFSTVISLSFALLPSVRCEIKKAFPSYKKQFHLFVTNDLFSHGGTFAAIIALSQLPVLVTKSISSTQAIFTLLFGLVIYKVFGGKPQENMSRENMIKKLLSFTFIIIGVLLVVIGGEF